jgi:hypothetical protein
MRLFTTEFAEDAERTKKSAKPVQGKNADKGALPAVRVNRRYRLRRRDRAEMGRSTAAPVHNQAKIDE